MTTERTRLLRALSTTKPASITSLALETGISEAAVEKHLADLQLEGLQFRVANQSGYQLAFAVDPIDEAQLKGALAAGGFPFVERVTLLDTVGSTNDWLTRRAAAGDMHGRACITEFQSAGRGRRGRSWQGGPYRHLMLSLGWCFQREAAALAGLSLSIGLALARELRQLGGRNIGLKWPNDLLCPAGKLGGILVDLIPQANAGSYAVVGVGINLDDSGLVGMAAGQRVTDLAAQLDGPLPQRSELAASVLTWLAQALARFDQLGFAGDQAEWNTLDVFAGKKISAVVEGEKVSGCGDGADATGCYRVRRDDGSIATLIAGEVSLSLEHPVTGAQKSAP